jgi:hypothetical protein
LKVISLHLLYILHSKFGLCVFLMIVNGKVLFDCFIVSACSLGEADILFLLDSSSSESRANFQKQVDFVSSIVQGLPIGPSNVQVGVISFATYAHASFHLNTHTDKASLLTALQHIHYYGGSTHTDRALHLARMQEFGSHYARRHSAAKIVVVCIFV